MMFRPKFAYRSQLGKETHNQRTNTDERDLRSTAECRRMRLMTKDFAFMTKIFAFECLKHTHRNSLGTAETLVD